MKILLLSIIISCSPMISLAQSKQVKTTKDTVVDSIKLEKKQKAIKCINLSSAGLNNVIVDHYKDAIRTISATPEDTTFVVFQPDSHAPEHYIEMVYKEVFQSKIWKTMENRLIEQGGTTFYDKIMAAYDNTGIMSVVGNKPTKEQWMYRFILPNLRAIYVNQLYWETFGPRIEKDDMSLVVEALNGYVQK